MIKDLVNWAIFEMVKQTLVVFVAGVLIGFILGAWVVAHWWL